MSLFLIGLVPIILFLVLLAGLKKSAMFSAYTSLVTAIILTFIVPAWRMPVQGILASILEGFAVAWMPIGFVVIAALFAYDLSVKTGKIETVKKMLGNITTDKRAQALVLAWGFGGFIEGIAGYGTAVAIPAAIMSKNICKKHLLFYTKIFKNRFFYYSQICYFGFINIKTYSFL